MVQVRVPGTVYNPFFFFFFFFLFSVLSHERMNQHNNNRPDSKELFFLPKALVSLVGCAHLWHFFPFLRVAIFSQVWLPGVKVLRPV
jgi:hypothetical protein